MVIKGVNTIGRQNTHLSLKMWFIALHFGNLKVLDVVLHGVSLKKRILRDLKQLCSSSFISLHCATRFSHRSAQSIKNVLSFRTSLVSSISSIISQQIVAHFENCLPQWNPNICCAFIMTVTGVLPRIGSLHRVTLSQQKYMCHFDGCLRWMYKFRGNPWHNVPPFTQNLVEALTFGPCVTKLAA